MFSREMYCATRFAIWLFQSLAALSWISVANLSRWCGPRQPTSLARTGAFMDGGD
jgi:hypothetical protein